MNKQEYESAKIIVEQEYCEGILCARCPANGRGPGFCVGYGNDEIALKWFEEHIREYETEPYSRLDISIWDLRLWTKLSFPVPLLKPT